MLARVAARASRTALTATRFRSLRTLNLKVPHDPHGVSTATAGFLASKPPSALQSRCWSLARHSSTFIQFDPEMTSLKAPQPPPVWKHSPEEVKKLTEEVLARVRSIHDQIAGIHPDKCDFESVRDLFSLLCNYLHRSLGVRPVGFG